MVGCSEIPELPANFNKVRTLPKYKKSMTVLMDGQCFNADYQTRPVMWALDSYHTNRCVVYSLLHTTTTDTRVRCTTVLVALWDDTEQAGSSMGNVAHISGSRVCG